MLKLQDNLFNARQRRDQPKLKLWRYAGLMLTYQCSAACRFCYYYCHPGGKGLMSVDTAIQSWQGLVRIAGDNAKIHMTGGEPFLCFDRLAQICEQAHRLKLTPIDSVETNAGIWDSAGELREKLRFLGRMGLNRLKISWDAFHEEYIEIEKVREFVSIARDVLGPRRVLIRWEKHLENPSGIRQLSRQQKQPIFLAALAEDSCRFTGRAAEELAPLAARFEVNDFQGKCCRNALLGAKGVHVDPFGNVFNGQCSGIILGNVNQTPLDVLWKTFEPDRRRFWRTLYSAGPFGLLDRAEKEGFKPKSRYASKCHLCTDIRSFFFDNRIYSTIIGPNSCYGR